MKYAIRMDMLQENIKGSTLWRTRWNVRMLHQANLVSRDYSELALRHRMLIVHLQMLSLGRSWKADELRRKSFNDLHTLWYVLTIERNALATQLDEARRVNVDAPSYTFLKEQSHRVGAVATACSIL